MTLSGRQVLVLSITALLTIVLLVSLPARAAISFRAVSTGDNGNGATNLVITKPVGLQVGDLMVASVAQKATGGFTHPSGWTYLGGQNNTGIFQMQLAYKVATSSDVAATDFTWIMSTSVRAAGSITAYSGVDTASPIGAWQTSQFTSSLNEIGSPTITTARDGSVTLAAFAQPTTAALTAVSATQRFNFVSGGGGGPTAKLTHAGTEKTIATSGTSTSTKMTTDTADGTEYMSTIVAVNPALPTTFTQSAYRWFSNTIENTFGQVTSNPTTGTDAIYAATNDTSYLYSTGYISTGGNDWRIGKRKLTDGTLVSGFGSGGTVDSSISANDDRAWGIDQDASYIYVVGQDATISSTNLQWRIEKRDKTTGALVSGFGTGGVIQNNPTSGLDVAKEVKVDGSYVYVAGFDNTGAGAWRIEKRDKTTGALVSGFGTGGVVVSDYAATSNDEIAAMVIDTNSIYVGGFDKNTGASNTQIRIEKRDKTTGALVSGFGTGGVVVENPFTGNAGTATEDAVVHKGLVLNGGNLYVAATQGVTGSTDFQWRIAKRDATTGALVSGFGTGGAVTVNPSTAIDNPTTIRTDGSALFIAGFDRSLDAGMSQWRIEKRDLTTGALITGFGTSGTVTSNPSTNHDEIRDMVIAGGNLYPVGYDVTPGNYEMRIEQRNTLTGVGPNSSAQPLAAQDTALGSVAQNDMVRLHVLLRAGTSLAALDSAVFKLQYAEKSGTCDAGFSGEVYADITGTTPIAFYDNPSLVDGSSQNKSIDEPVDGANPVLYQQYSDTGNFKNTSDIPVGSNGLWDISLYNLSAPDGKSYCFRVVDSTGTVLNAYSQFPELSTPPLSVLTQESYRLFTNSDSTTPGSPLAAQNTPASISSNSTFRLRQLLASTLNATGTGRGFKLQYAQRGVDGVCDTGFNAETYADVPSISGSLTGNASAVSTDASIGNTAWSNFLLGIDDDGSNATIDSPASTGTNTSQYLKLTGFNLSIPVGATITGITVNLDRYSSAPGGGLGGDNSIKIIKNSTITGTDHDKPGGDWYGSAITSYGSDTDLWGSSWTPADINSANFGVAVSVAATWDDFGGVPTTVGIDSATITVNYTLPQTSAISYANNPTPANGAVISSTANDPTFGAGTVRLQNYVEQNPALTSTAIANGEAGLWDVAISGDATTDGKTYCFRFVRDDGGLLGSYSQIPEVTFGSGSTTPTLDQQLRGGQSVIDGIKRGFMW